MDVIKISKEVNRNKWRQIIQNRIDSGEQVKVWCRKNKINPSTYYFWLKTLRQEQCDIALASGVIDSSANFVALPNKVDDDAHNDSDECGAYLSIGKAKIVITNHISDKLLNKLLEQVK